jgi:hypothetical protein
MNLQRFLIAYEQSSSTSRFTSKWKISHNERSRNCSPRMHWVCSCVQLVLLSGPLPAVYDAEVAVERESVHYDSVRPRAPELKSVVVLNQGLLMATDNL